MKRFIITSDRDHSFISVKNNMSDVYDELREISKAKWNNQSFMLIGPPLHYDDDTNESYQEKYYLDSVIFRHDKKIEYTTYFIKAIDIETNLLTSLN